ncbi:MAG: ferredoxin--NADP reductase [Burkholderiales bacterium]
MEQWLEGTVVGKTVWTERLLSLQIAADIEPFEAGQFIKVGLKTGDEVIARPYSLVNAPHERPLEICFSIVPGGPLSRNLAALDAGNEILVAPRAHGFLVLSEIAAGSDLWLMATGTGIGPFLSILKTEAPWQRFERIILVHAVRLAKELMYRDLMDEFTARYADKFLYVPFVSGEDTGFALTGRITHAITSGQLENHAGIQFRAAQSRIALCGNPQMVKEVQQLLIDRGLKKHRRFDPGNISVENYW